MFTHNIKEVGEKLLSCSSYSYTNLVTNAKRRRLDKDKRLCDCPCKQQFTRHMNHATPPQEVRYINGHQTRGKNNPMYGTEGANFGKYRNKSSAWKGGRYINSAGYVLIYAPTHHRASSIGYVLEHILVYEKYHKCCVLKSGIVHHKNKVRIDNRIENLQLMSIPGHSRLPRVDMSDWTCSACDSKTTQIEKRNGRPHWYYDNDGNRLCGKCYDKYRHPIRRPQQLAYYKEYYLKHKKQQQEYKKRRYALKQKGGPK